MSWVMVMDAPVVQTGRTGTVQCGHAAPDATRKSGPAAPPATGAIRSEGPVMA